MAVIQSNAVSAHFVALRDALDLVHPDAMHRLQLIPYASDEERVLWVITVDTPDVPAAERPPSGDVLGAQRALDAQIMRDMGIAWAVTKSTDTGHELRATNLGAVMYGVA